jgi:hypothetical protein
MNKIKEEWMELFEGDNPNEIQWAKEAADFFLSRFSELLKDREKEELKGFVSKLRGDLMATKFDDEDLHDIIGERLLEELKNYE